MAFERDLQSLRFMYLVDQIRLCKHLKKKVIEVSFLCQILSKKQFFCIPTGSFAQTIQSDQISFRMLNCFRVGCCSRPNVSSYLNN